MNKEEAFNSMLKGNKITCPNFTSEEYLWYNPETGKITTEEGYYMNNFWDKDYLPNVKWTIY